MTNFRSGHRETRKLWTMRQGWVKVVGSNPAGPTKQTLPAQHGWRRGIFLFLVSHSQIFFIVCPVRLEGKPNCARYSENKGLEGTLSIRIKQGKYRSFNLASRIGRKGYLAYASTRSRAVIIPMSISSGATMGSRFMCFMAIVAAAL